MIEYNVGCMDCGKVVATVQIKEVEEYKGDNYYSFRCEDCQNKITQAEDSEN